MQLGTSLHGLYSITYLAVGKLVSRYLSTVCRLACLVRLACMCWVPPCWIDSTRTRAHVAYSMPALQLPASKPVDSRYLSARWVDSPALSRLAIPHRSCTGTIQPASQLALYSVPCYFVPCFVPCYFVHIYVPRAIRQQLIAGSLPIRMLYKPPNLQTSKNDPLPSGPQTIQYSCLLFHT